MSTFANLGIPDLPGEHFGAALLVESCRRAGRECAEGSELRVTGSRAITGSASACPRGCTGKPCKPGYAVR